MKRVATSPLTGRVYFGRVNVKGDAFVGTKQDVTSDVLRAVIEKAQFHGGAFEIASSDQSEVYDVTVTKRLSAKEKK